MTDKQKTPDSGLKSAGAKPDVANKRKDSDFQRYSQMLELSFYSPRNFTKSSRKVTLYKVWRLMISGKLAGVVKEDNPLAQYQNRGERNEPELTPLMGADFDHVRDVGALKQLLLDSPTPPIMLHVTASGQGLRAIFALTEDALDSYDHRARGEALNRYLLDIGAEGLDDDVTTDIKRMWYINHDPGAMLNEDFRPIDSSFMRRWGNGATELRSAEKLASTDDEDAELGHFATTCEIERICKTIKKPFEDGRSTYVMRLYYLCGKAGTDRGVLDDYVEANLTRSDFTMGEILKTCALRYEVGRNERIKELEARKARLDPDKYRVLTTDAIEPPTPVLSAPDGEIVGSEGNIVLLLGKAKSKKTFLAQLMVSEFIQDNTEDVVIWVDTEQALSHTQKIAHRIKALCDGELNEENFRLYALRELMPKDRAEFIERACKKYQPRLVVIDGIVDICTNFLDLERSTETVQQLMTLSSELQCLIVGVLHENKSREDRNGRGHLGTIATQKAETVMNLTAVTNCDLVQVEFTYTRNKPPQGFTFSVGDDGLPYISCAGIPKLPKDYELWKSRLPEPMGHADLMRRVMADTGKSEATAKRHIAIAIGGGVIYKVGDKYAIMEIEPL